MIIFEGIQFPIGMVVIPEKVTKDKDKNSSLNIPTKQAYHVHLVCCPNDWNREKN